MGVTSHAVLQVRGAPLGDTLPPARVTTLALDGPVLNGEATLIWTAAGDDGFDGRAAEFDIRYSAAGVINDGNWAAATSLFGGWTPNYVDGGYTVDYLVNDPGAVPVWYAVRYRDAAGNTGVTSNNCQVSTWGY